MNMSITTPLCWPAYNVGYGGDRFGILSKEAAEECFSSSSLFMEAHKSGYSVSQFLRDRSYTNVQNASLKIFFHV